MNNKNLPSLNEASELAFGTALNYAAVLPGGDLPRSKEALAEYQDIYQNEEGGERPESLVAKNLLMMQSRMAAKIDQALRIKDKLMVDGENRKNKIAAARSWDRKVLETGFLPKKELAAEKRTMGKLVQEILSSDYELVGGLTDAKLDMAIIDPMKITDTLLVNLGLEEFVPEKKSTEVDALVRKSEAIEEIKEMFQGLEPLKISSKLRRNERRFLRLFTITEGKYQGYILGTQVIYGQKVLFRTDLHGALRRLENIDQGYGEEIATLAGIDEKVIAAKDHLGKNKTGLYSEFKKYQEEKKTGERVVMNKPEAMLMYEEMIEKMLGNLGGVINGEKIKIHKQLTASKDLVERKTKQARVKIVKGKRVEFPEEKVESMNIEAKLARLSAIHDSFAKRIEEIRRIKVYLLADEHILKTEVSRLESPFDNFLELVEKMHEQFRIYSGRVLSGQEKYKVAESIEGRILQPLESAFPTDETALEPYSSFKKAMFEQSSKTKELLLGRGSNTSLVEECNAEDQSQKLGEEFTKIYLVAKVVKLHKDLQAFYAENLSGETVVEGQRMLKDIEKIREDFGKRKVAPQLEVKDFGRQFDEFYHLLNSLRKRAVEISEKDLEIEEMKNHLLNKNFENSAFGKKQLTELEKARRKLRMKAKGRFRNFDFGKMIGGLDVENQ